MESADLMIRAVQILEQRCIVGLQVNRERCSANNDDNVRQAAVLASIVGHDQAERMLQQARESGRSLEEVAAEEGFIDLSWCR